MGSRSRSGTLLSMNEHGGNPFASVRDAQETVVGSQHTLHILSDPDAGSQQAEDEPLSATRARSDTFGGIPLPPSTIVTPASPSVSSLDEDAKTFDPTKSTASPTRAYAGRHGVATLNDRLSVSRPPINRSRSSSLTSLHLGGGTFFSRRPMLTAGLQALALFLVSLFASWLALKMLLPPFDPEDWSKIKVPKSFDDLKELNAVLQSYKERGYFRIMACFAVVYLFIQAFSIPGSMYLSMLAGALYGVLVALPLVCFCVATGALMCYFLSAALGNAFLSSPKWTRRLHRWNDRIDAHRSDLIPYMIVLRIAPLPPHWVVNIIAPHLNISVWTFWVSTFLGIAGVSYIHTQIGTTLDQMTSSDDFHLISWGNALGLGGVVVAALVPVLLRRLWRNDLEDAAKDDDQDTIGARTATTSISDDGLPARDEDRRGLLANAAPLPIDVPRRSHDENERRFKLNDLERGSL